MGQDTDLGEFYYIKTIAVFGELVGSVSVKKIASGLLSSVEEKQTCC